MVKSTFEARIDEVSQNVHSMMERQVKSKETSIERVQSQLRLKRDNHRLCSTVHRYEHETEIMNLKISLVEVAKQKISKTNQQKQELRIENQDLREEIAVLRNKNELLREKMQKVTDDHNVAFASARLNQATTIRRHKNEIEHLLSVERELKSSLLAQEHQIHDQAAEIEKLEAVSRNRAATVANRQIEEVQEHENRLHSHHIGNVDSSSKGRFIARTPSIVDSSSKGRFIARTPSIVDNPREYAEYRIASSIPENRRQHVRFVNGWDQTQNITTDDDECSRYATRLSSKHNTSARLQRDSKLTIKVRNYAATNQMMILHGVQKRYNVQVRLDEDFMHIGSSAFAYTEIDSVCSRNTNLNPGNAITEYCIAIRSSKGSILLQAASCSARDEWIEAIQEELAKRQQTQATKIRFI